MQDLYTGGAGQAAVMSEFLVRGYNVAVPEVDRGDDLFVVQDLSGNFHRIQVKTATARGLKRQGYVAQFVVPLAQLSKPHTPELFYVLAVRHESKWSDFLVIPRTELFDEHVLHNVGSVIKAKYVMLRFSFQAGSVSNCKRSFQTKRGDFSNWPRIQH